MGVRAIETLQVIFKIAERCNLNCPYCYYFSGADSKIDLRPPVIPRDSATATVDFLVQACSEIDVKNVQIVFHGGEPTLVKPRVFDELCVILRDKLSGVTKLNLSIQTNGVHLSNDWMDQLKKHNVSVGVSLDGPAVYNDPLRPDHRGRGSHDRIVNTIARLTAESDANTIRPIGLVSVLNKDFDYSLVYQHFVNDLNVKNLNFLLPDCNQDAGADVIADVPKYGKVLCDVFDLWLMNGQDRIYVREIDRVLTHFNVNVHYRQLPDDCIANQIIVVHSDGHLDVDDTFMPAFEWFTRQPTADVRSTTLKNWLDQPMFEQVKAEQKRLPTDCADCPWRGICRGGDIENRFSRRNGCDNRSVYCAALFQFYEHVSATLVEGDYHRPLIQEMVSKSLKAFLKEPDDSLAVGGEVA